MAFPINARFAHPDAGWKADQEQCARLLTIGETYTVSHLKVGPFSSVIHLTDFPAEQFNTVMFDGITCEVLSDPDMADMAGKIAGAAIDAAAPHIAAAERERIRQLAIELAARYHRCGATSATPFADLIKDPQ